MRSFDADSADSMLDFTLGFDAEDTAENALATWLLFAPTCMLFWANTPWYLDMSMEVVQNPHLRPPEVEVRADVRIAVCISPCALVQRLDSARPLPSW